MQMTEFVAKKRPVIIRLKIAIFSMKCSIFWVVSIDRLDLWLTVPYSKNLNFPVFFSFYFGIRYFQKLHSTEKVILYLHFKLKQKVLKLPKSISPSELFLFKLKYILFTYKRKWYFFHRMHVLGGKSQNVKKSENFENY